MGTQKDWNNLKTTLGKAVDIGETVGMSDKTITNIAERVGTFLSNNVNPSTEEERILKELWDVSNDSERQVLAGLVVKMVDK
ncbi:DUF3243 domain-containing protein [Anaeromicrobium sediminis]|uniref:DUF3243 domain-containing protein n=1 Tax=Anaeromicrobium sediminis TaxID=1478221 RepID=A0A267MNC8_9FIRM|nr:DUF3243 domain-containing protein [Anaeromicrobium sediminis]PAB61121.1 hypothetical protein CCE28_01460 [Anaeromicrobium sediminis]